MGVRYGGAKRSKYRFECPNASSGKKNGNVRCRNLSAARAAHSSIHPDSRRSTYFFVPFLFIVIEPGCSRSFLFIIWLNSYTTLFASDTRCVEFHGTHAGGLILGRTLSVCADEEVTFFRCSSGTSLHEHALFSIATRLGLTVVYTW